MGFVRRSFFYQYLYSQIIIECFPAIDKHFFIFYRNFFTYFASFEKEFCNILFPM